MAAAWYFVYLPHQAAERAEANELVKKGRGEIGDEKYAEAVSDLEGATKLDSKSVDAWRALADAHRHMKHWDQAVTALKRATKIRQDDADVLEDLGFVYFEQEKWGDASEAYERALKLKPDSSNAYYWLGCIHENQREIEKALSAFQRAVDLKPGDKYALVGLGRLQAARSNWVAASSSFQKAISIDESFASAWAGIGGVQAGKKDWREALDAYQKAVHLEPKFLSAWMAIGFISRQVDDLDGACASFQKVVDLKPEMADGWTGLGVVYRRQEKTREAVECLENAVRLDPKSAFAWGGLGYAYADQGKWDEAVQAFDKAEKLGPEMRIPISCGRAYLAQKEGKTEEAAISYREALKVAPDYADGWVGLGEVLIIQKKWAEAETAFDRALQDDARPRIVRLRNRAAYEDGVERSEALMNQQRWAEAKTVAEKLERQEDGDKRAAELAERADKEMRYSEAIEKAKDFVANQIWVSAAEQIDQALLLKPGAVEALKIQDSIKASVEEAKFSADVTRLRVNFGQERYADAIVAGEEALQLRPSDAGTRELISQVRVAQEKQERFNQALARASSLLDNKQWKEAHSAVAEARAIRSDDRRVGDLENRIRMDEADAVRAGRASKRAELLATPVLDAEKLMSDCWNADDRITAGNFENRYKGKRARYLGTISEIDVKNGIVNFQRKGFLSTSYHVRVLLPTRSPEQVNALVKGQKVWVVGTLDALAPPDGSKVLGFGIVAGLAGSNSIRIVDADFVRPEDAGD
jgi:tetratricopeptide (TPR) repeat protein